MSTTIVALHRENIGRGDKEQPIVVVRLREEPCQFRFKLAWSYPLKGARVSLSGVGFFREVFITVKRFGKRAILLLG